MIDIENFEKEFEEIKKIHAYIQNRHRKYLIIFLAFQIIFWSSFIFFCVKENVAGSIIFGVLAMVSMGFIYPLVMNRQRFMIGNFFEKMSKYFYEHTKYKLVIRKNVKIDRNILSGDSNIIDSSFSKSLNLVFDVYNQEESISPLLSLYYGTYNRGKDIIFSGSVITTNCDSIKTDCKILGMGLSSLAGNYTRNKDLAVVKDFKCKYFYNRKNETTYDERLTKIISMVSEMLNCSEDYHPFGIGIKDGKLNILIALQGRKYNFSFIRKFSEFNVEKYFNELLNIFDLVNKIKEEMSE